MRISFIGYLEFHNTQVDGCWVGQKGEGSSGVFKHVECYWNDIWRGLVLDVYDKVTQETLCFPIMGGPSTSGASEGVVLQGSILGEVLGEQGLVVAKWYGVDISSWIHFYWKRLATLFGN